MELGEGVSPRRPACVGVSSGSMSMSDSERFRPCTACCTVSLLGSRSCAAEGPSGCWAGMLCGASALCCWGASACWRAAGAVSCQATLQLSAR